MPPCKNPASVLWQVFRGVARCCLPRFQAQPQHLKYQNWIKKLVMSMWLSGSVQVSVDLSGRRADWIPTNFDYNAKLFLINRNLLYPEKTYGQEFGGPLNLAALCGRIGRILAKAGSVYIFNNRLHMFGGKMHRVKVHYRHHPHRKPTWKSRTVINDARLL